MSTEIFNNFINKEINIDEAITSLLEIIKDMKKKEDFTYYFYEKSNLNYLELLKQEEIYINFINNQKITNYRSYLCNMKSESIDSRYTLLIELFDHLSNNSI